MVNERITAADQLGISAALAWRGDTDISYSSPRVSTLSPALIAIFVQLSAALIPILMERCLLDHTSMQRMVKSGLSRRDRRTLAAEVRKQVGWFNWLRYGRYRIVDACCAVVGRESFLPQLRAME